MNENVRNDLNNSSESIGSFDSKEYRGNGPHPTQPEMHEEVDYEHPKTPKYQQWTFAALSPFIFLALGFAFGWWSFAWLIIPVASVLSAPIDFNKKIVALSPFIYIAMGFAFGWWAWGWMIIPVSAILFAGLNKRP